MEAHSSMISRKEKEAAERSRVRRVARRIVAMSARDLQALIVKSSALAKIPEFRALQTALVHLRKSLRDGARTNWGSLTDIFDNLRNSYSPEKAESVIIDALFAGSPATAISAIKDYYAAERGVEKFRATYPDDPAVLAGKIQNAAKKARALSFYDAIENLVDGIIDEVSDCKDFWKNCAEGAEEAVEGAIGNERVLSAISGNISEIKAALEAISTKLDTALDENTLVAKFRTLKPIREKIDAITVPDEPAAKNSEPAEIDADGAERKFHDPAKQPTIQSAIADTETRLENAFEQEIITRVRQAFNGNRKKINDGIRLNGLERNSSGTWVPTAHAQTTLGIGTGSPPRRMTGISIQLANEMASFVLSNLETAKNNFIDDFKNGKFVSCEELLSNLDSSLYTTLEKEFETGSSSPGFTDIQKWRNFYNGIPSNKPYAIIYNEAIKPVVPAAAARVLELLKRRFYDREDVRTASRKTSAKSNFTPSGKDSMKKQFFSSETVRRIARRIVAMTAKDFRNELIQNGALNKVPEFAELKKNLSALHKALQDKKSSFFGLIRNYNPEKMETEMIDAIFAGDASKAINPIKNYYRCSKAVAKFLERFPDDENKLKEEISSANKKKKALDFYQAIVETFDEVEDQVYDCKDFWKNCAEGADGAIEDAIDNEKALEAFRKAFDIKNGVHPLTNALKAVAGKIEASLDIDALKAKVKQLEPIYNMIQEIHFDGERTEEHAPEEERPRDEETAPEGGEAAPAAETSNEEMTAEKVQAKYNDESHKANIEQVVVDKKPDVEGLFDTISDVVEDRIYEHGILNSDELMNAVPSDQKDSIRNQAKNKLKDFSDRIISKLKEQYNTCKFLELENTINRIPETLRNNLQNMFSANHNDAVKWEEYTGWGTAANGDPLDKIQGLDIKLNALKQLVSTELSERFYKTDEVRTAGLRRPVRLAGREGRIAMAVARDFIGRLA